MKQGGWPPDYSLCDPAFSDWATKQSLAVVKDWQGDSDVVRTVWLDEKQVQMWLDPPDTEKFVTVNAARRSDLNASGWDFSIKLRVPIQRLREALDVVWKTVNGWS
jgi:hypothetical protein